MGDQEQVELVAVAAMVVVAVEVLEVLSTPLLFILRLEPILSPWGRGEPEARIQMEHLVQPHILGCLPPLGVVPETTLLETFRGVRAVEPQAVPLAGLDRPVLEIRVVPVETRFFGMRAAGAVLRRLGQMHLRALAVPEEMVRPFQLQDQLQLPLIRRVLTRLRVAVGVLLTMERREPLVLEGRARVWFLEHQPLEQQIAVEGPVGLRLKRLAQVMAAQES